MGGAKPPIVDGEIDVHIDVDISNIKYQHNITQNRYIDIVLARYYFCQNICSEIRIFTYRCLSAKKNIVYGEGSDFA